MSWLNFNEGLSSIKGQLTNLAQSVLTEEDDRGMLIKFKCSLLNRNAMYILDSIIKSTEYEELKKICVRQEQEVSMSK